MALLLEGQGKVADVDLNAADWLGSGDDVGDSQARLSVGSCVELGPGGA
jgi:hypothetical protein